MRRRWWSIAVSLVLVTAVTAPAWALCGSALVLAASGDVCPMPAEDHCGKSDARARADCCLLDARMPDANVPPAVVAAPGSKLAPDTTAVVPSSINSGVPGGPALGIVARAPLKPPRTPTHLRNSVLLI